MPLGALSAFGRTSLQTIRLRRSSECLNAPQGIVCFQTILDKVAKATTPELVSMPLRALCAFRPSIRTHSPLRRD